MKRYNSAGHLINDSAIMAKFVLADDHDKLVDLNRELEAALKAMLDRFGVPVGSSVACDRARALLTPLETPEAMYDRIVTETTDALAQEHFKGDKVPLTAQETPASSMDHGGIRQVGCERPDGMLNIHTESETCEVCSVAETKGDANG